VTVILPDSLAQLNAFDPSGALSLGEHLRHGLSRCNQRLAERCPVGRSSSHLFEILDQGAGTTFQPAKSSHVNVSE
jgi:hypothetical protein